MSASSGQPALVLRLSAPMTDLSRLVIKELTAKVAGTLASSDAHTKEAVAAVERVTHEVARGGARDEAVEIEFSRDDEALLIQARSGRRTAHARHRLPGLPA